MEPNNAESSLFSLQVDDISASYFREGTKWARFLAIVYFVCIGGFVLIFTFASGAIITGLSSIMPGLEMLGGILAVAVTIAAMIGVLITILLYRFAIRVRQGIETQDQIVFNDGLKSLKYYFIVTGIISMLGLVFTILGALMSGVATSQLY